MNVAVVFAGGTGQRMNNKTRPKQFLELNGKPILVYTLEVFQNHDSIDAIVLVTLEEWINHCHKLVERYQLKKVQAIVPGGKTAPESTFYGLRKARDLFPEDTIVLIHDGVRPLVDEETITKCITCTKENGSAITISPAIETITMIDPKNRNENPEIIRIIERSECQLARAPQTFYLKDVLPAYESALGNSDKQFIDSATIMMHFGCKLYTIEGKPENIKITTPIDYYMFRAIIDAREKSEVFGV